MSLPLLTLDVRLEPDVLLARQRARQVAGLLGFAPLDQTRIATAVSEIARNAFQYAGGGKVEFQVNPGPAPKLLVRIQERGSGIKDLQAILDGQYDSSTGLGIGILGAKRLMDQFEIGSSENGVIVTMAKGLPRRASPLTPQDLARVSSELAQHKPRGPLEELQVQNQELLRTLQELRDRQAEIAELHNRELEETNRGVVALYSELDENAKELRRISDLKSRFLSNMSHEFRSPLNTILSMCGFLLNGSSGDTERRAGKGNHLHSQGRRRSHRPGQRPAGPGEGRGGQGRHPTGGIRGRRSVRDPQGDDKTAAHSRLGDPDRRRARRDKHAPYRRGQGRADSQEFPLERREVHRSRRDSPGRQGRTG